MTSTDTAGGGTRVLYVNDDEAFADLVAAKLGDAHNDFDVTTTTDRASALDAVDDGGADCVVTAYTLADGTGTELVEAVESRAPDLPTILFTGRGSEQIAGEATRAGVDDYIPVQSTDDAFTVLVQRIETLVDAARQRQRAEHAATRFERILERTTDAIYAVDSEWRVEYMNEKMAARVDRDREDVVGTILWEEFPSVADTEIASKYRTAMETGESVAFEQYIEEPFDYWVEVRAFPDDDGLTVVSQKITERRERERALERERDALRALQSVMAAETTVDEQLSRLLEVGCNRLGLDLGLVARIEDRDYEVRAATPPDADIAPGDQFALGDTFCETVVGSDAVQSFADAAAVGRDSHPAYRANGVESYIGAPLFVDDERYGTLNFSSTSPRTEPFDDFEETLVELLCELVERVLSRARDRQELERTNQRLESLIQAAPMTVMEVERDGTVSLWNRAAEETFGWTTDEVRGEFNPMVPDEAVDNFEANRDRVFEGARIRGKEVQRVTKEGETLDLLLSAAPLVGPEGEVSSVIATMEDITEQKRIERQFRALQTTARQLTEASSVERVGEIAVSAAVDILGLDATALWQYDEQADVLEPLTASEGAHEMADEIPSVGPEGSLVWECFESGDTGAYDDLRDLTGQYTDASELRSAVIVPLGDTGVLATGSAELQEFSDTDIDLFRVLAATVEAALGRTQREVELQRQNERLDEFASVVAHDLRNPLTVAKGFLDIAEDTGDAEHFKKVANAHTRIERLVDDLLTLARGETTIEDAVEVDLTAVAREAWGYVDTDAATLTVADDTPTVRGDAGRLTQVFENLFRNAVEHGGEDVTVTVGALGDDEGFFVADDGPGIPEDDRERVFDHGVTTNEKGTGFGLSIVADIARAHEWTVSATESESGGARFDFET